MKKLNNKGFAISTIIYGTLILFVVLMTILIYTLQFRYRNLSNSNLINNSGSIENTDATGEPNPPDLSTGLVPIVYDKDHWEIADTSQKWYDYAKQEWANAASLKSTVPKTPRTILDIENDVYAMFVWIPRFSYTIGCGDSYLTCYGYKVENDPISLSQNTPGAIDIKFEQGTESETLTGTYPRYTYSSSDTDEVRKSQRETHWYTHPAFTFGGEELSGIWVGKFETSTAIVTPCYDSTTWNCSAKPEEIRILPNVKSQRNQKISKQFDSARYLTTDQTYGLAGNSHMMKNSEWGAVAYLSQSKYGKFGNRDYSGENKEIYVNNSSDNFTGRSGGTPSAASAPNGTYTYNVSINGTGASTTGNIYGIYDMNGGANEYVMGNYNNKIAYSGFQYAWLINSDNIMYFDKYEIKDIFSEENKTTNGGALAETASWYYDSSDAFSESKAWLLRGGGAGQWAQSGLFKGTTSEGSPSEDWSFRVVLIFSETYND